MFRQMRRKNQLLSAEDTAAVLKRGTAGVLALSGDNGYPYAVPLSYVYDDGKIYFHSAKSGHKIDAVCGSEKASFCVIDKDQIVPEKFTTYFRSVIAFGTIRILEKEDEKRAAIAKLAMRYSPEIAPAKHDEEIDKSMNALCMLEMTIEHMTGKQAKELAGSDTAQA